MPEQKDLCLPTFIIGGAPRSGTTFLCHVLDKHPDVYIAKPFEPEPKICLKPCAEGIESYQKQYHELFAPIKNKKALGEKSSAYFENYDAFLRLQLIFQQENTRFLFILREPIKRAYSNYLRSKNNGFETMSFQEAINLEGQRQDPFPPEKSYVRPFDYLIRGDYATFAERYLNAFGADRVKFVFFENIQLAPEQFYRDVQIAIGVEPLARAFLETAPVNASQHAGETLDNYFEQELRERIRPTLDRFASITGLDIGVWGY